MASITSPAGAPQGGIRGVIATALRSVGSGYHTITSGASQQAEAAMLHPLDGVQAVTNTLRDVTSRIPVINKVTGMIDKFGGAIMMTTSANFVEGYNAPGSTISNIAHKAADLIDGQHSTGAWSPTVTPPSAAGGVPLLRASDTGEFLAQLGVR
jgi:hypothetical protein